jgi:hypothetical protein
MKIQPKVMSLSAASRADLFSKYKKNRDKIDEAGKTHPEIY